jgi:hypothetical protein
VLFGFSVPVIITAFLARTGLDVAGNITVTFET